MADLEFFFDPGCPWAWITSRWVTEVKELRDYDVQWRFISLQVLNEHRIGTDGYSPEYQAMHQATHRALRVAVAVAADYDNDAVARLYTELGTRLHKDGRRGELAEDSVKFCAEALSAAGLPESYADAVDDESFDELLRSETAEALERTGKDVGTPMLTFHPGQDDEGSFFGPVISTIPRGEKAKQLWDAIELLATTSQVAELKRSLRARPVFD